MNQEQIIQMAREANLPACHATHPKALERFAKLVAEHCAKICEDNWHECGGQCANVIRYGDQA